MELKLWLTVVAKGIRMFKLLSTLFHHHNNSLVSVAGHNDQCNNYPKPNTTKKIYKTIPDSPKCRSGRGKIVTFSMERHTGPQWVVRVPSWLEPMILVATTMEKDFTDNYYISHDSIILF
ncbi:hypothetical protein VNO77_17622 [Canavalia gladiata]|uniref:Uncharacterized protein n=1 Tax=Canavalia gladiata TaxID=3824 RepID=A0AAN9LMX9_CANGL